MILNIGGINLNRDMSIFMGNRINRSTLISVVLCRGMMPSRLGMQYWGGYLEDVVLELRERGEFLNMQGIEMEYLVEWEFGGGRVTPYWDVDQYIEVFMECRYRILLFASGEDKLRYEVIRDGSSKYNERKLAMEIKGGKWKKPGGVV